MCARPRMPLGTHLTTRWGVQLPWICMSRSWSLDHDRLSVNQSCAEVALWINDRPIRGPILPGSLLVSRVLLL